MSKQWKVQISKEEFDIVQNPIKVKDMISCEIVFSTFRQSYITTVTYSEDFFESKARLIESSPVST